MILSDYKQQLLQSKGKALHLRDNLALVQKTEKELIEKRDNLEKAQIFLQKVATDTQNQLRVHIQSLMQMCLDMFWQGEIDFDLEFESKRGKSECRLVFLVDGEEVNPMDADGGGLVDIAAFGLRICAWTLGTTRNTIVLDEPMKNLSAEHRGQASQLLKEISEKLGIQFILVTHEPEIAEVADRAFRVERKRVGDYYESSVKVM